MLNKNLVGIISDTHDHRSNIQKAVAEFNNAGCSLVIHAGDYVAPFTVQEFGKLACPLVGVFGNNDGERKGLATLYAPIGSLYEPPHEFVHYDMRFVVMHEPDKLATYMARDEIDVIVYGHLHEIDIRPGKPLVINPGESCLWLSDRATIVLLDLSTMDVNLLDL